jgi:hypothetical protein
MSKGESSDEWQDVSKELDNSDYEIEDYLHTRTPFPSPVVQRHGSIYIQTVKKGETEIKTSINVEQKQQDTLEKKEDHDTLEREQSALKKLYTSWKRDFLYILKKRKTKMIDTTFTTNNIDQSITDNLVSHLYEIFTEKDFPKIRNNLVSKVVRLVDDNSGFRWTDKIMVVNNLMTFLKTLKISGHEKKVIVVSIVKCIAKNVSIEDPSEKQDMLRWIDDEGLKVIDFLVSIAPKLFKISKFRKRIQNFSLCWNKVKRSVV